MEDLKTLMQSNYLKYASYVILDRAIPDVVDGLKPVQRRILHTLFRMHDGKLHKVANVAGQTMAYHPHGDAAIIDALVNLSNKGYLLDQQGNFGNIYTGDPAAAARYIETRLSPLAKETLFNPDLTTFVPSYDGRNKEPVTLPAKLPFILIQGASGIAVGMSTNIFPHNFVELLKAEIAILEEKPFKILPDFPTGGILDATDYDKGRGKVKLRAKIDIKDSKTLVITQICYGTSTESLISSIDDAAKRGKIKIDAINDYTADKVEIEIKLPRGHYAQDLIDALYAYTECEVTLNSQLIVIKDNLPWETNVDEVLHYHVNLIKKYFHQELELEKQRILDKIFDKTLEQIFIEHRLYKDLETVPSQELIHSTVAKSLEPYHKQLVKVPSQEDRERLLQIPIRRISRFDIDKNQEDIVNLNKQLKKIEGQLKNIKQYAIDYLNSILEKYGKDYKRKTKIQEIEEIDFKAISTKDIKIGYDLTTGFVGTKVTGQGTLLCTNYDKIIIFFKNGTYKITNIPEKDYLHSNDNKAVFVGVADKESIVSVVYKDPASAFCFAKRFIASKFILDKQYRFFDEGMTLELLSTNPTIELEVQFIPKLKQKTTKMQFSFKQVLVKGSTSKGIRIAPKPIHKIKILKDGP